MDQRKIISTKNTNSSTIIDNNNDIENSKEEDIDRDIDGFEKKINKQKNNSNGNQKLRDIMSTKQQKIKNVIDTKKIVATTIDPNAKKQKAIQDARDLTTLVNNGVPIGDVSLEQVVTLLSYPVSAELFPIVLSTNRYKKDYFILEFNDPRSLITKLGVFALFFNGKTYVLNTTNKRGMNETIITYAESALDPSAIVETAYFYQKQIDRTLYLKSVAVQQNNPERLEDLTIVQIPEKPVNQLFTDEIPVTYIAPELINLSIIIKNGNYISTTDFNTLNAVVTIMIAF